MPQYCFLYHTNFLRLTHHPRIWHCNLFFASLKNINIRLECVQISCIHDIEFPGTCFIFPHLFPTLKVPPFEFSRWLSLTILKTLYPDLLSCLIMTLLKLLASKTIDSIRFHQFHDLLGLHNRQYPL